MSTPRLEHRNVKVQQLISEFRNGSLMIPEFQRDFVWKRSKAPLLLESLYKSFPISSLLVWQSEDRSTTKARTNRRQSNSGPARWLVDGQQRVTTLSRISSGDQDIDVLFNLDTEEFQLPNATTRNDPTNVRVADIWDDEEYRRLRRRFETDSSWDRREARLELVRRILQYEVPIVEMLGHSFESAVEAFSRINTLGVKLRSADIESAKIAAKHTGFIVENVLPFVKELHEDGFERLTVMHLFRACAFIATPDGRTRTPLHDLERRQVLSAWNKTEDATRKTIDLVRSEFGLMKMDILWSGALMVPVIAMRANTRPRDIDTSEMAGWMALAAMLHRYRSSADSALDADLKACREEDAIGALLKNLRKDSPSLEATDVDFNGSLADRSALFAAYVACKHRGIGDFNRNGSVALQRDIDRHHILPRGQFATSVRATADCVANIAYISGGVNKAINVTGPEVYLQSINPKILKSQCIPLDPDLWTVKAAEEFWNQRRQLLAEAFNDYIRTVLPNRRF